MHTAILAMMSVAGAVIAPSMSNTPTKTTAQLIFPSSASSTPPATGSAGPASAALSPSAAANSACLITSNVTCMCTDIGFQSQFTSCFQAGCLPSEMNTALGLLVYKCAAASLSVSTAQTAGAISLPPSTDTQAADISFITSATTAHTSPTLSLHRRFRRHFPSAAPTDTSIFKTSAAHITISVDDASPVTTATTAMTGANDGIRLSIDRTGMGMTLLVLVLGGFAAL
ncbi:hypothetical protein DFH09DRAFT_1102206 [Mycena vulgaris]|nr:hypothetical protein DFH09DRAFT_1102206 [Mycena vulgaris]